MLRDSENTKRTMISFIFGVKKKEKKKQAKNPKMIDHTQCLQFFLCSK